MTYKNNDFDSDKPFVASKPQKGFEEVWIHLMGNIGKIFLRNNENNTINSNKEYPNKKYRKVCTNNVYVTNSR